MNDNPTSEAGPADNESHPAQRLDWRTVKIRNLDYRPPKRKALIGYTGIPVSSAVGIGGSALCIAAAVFLLPFQLWAGCILALIISVMFLIVAGVSVTYISTNHLVLGSRLEALPERVRTPLAIGLLAIEDIKSGTAYRRGMLGELDLRAAAWALTRNALRAADVLDSSDQLRAANLSLTADDELALQHSSRAAAEVLDILDRDSAMLARAAVDAQRVSTQLDRQQHSHSTQLTDPAAPALTSTAASEVGEAVIARTSGYDAIGFTAADRSLDQ